MNNLLSYCGLVDAKIRASDKDLPVNLRSLKNWKKSFYFFSLSFSRCVYFRIVSCRLSAKERNDLTEEEFANSRNLLEMSKLHIGRSK